MSIHDIDKQTGGRVAPQPNTSDDVLQRMAQGTNQIQNAGEEDDSGLRTLERQILAVQDGTNKAIMGFYGEANKFGFKVAEDGVDVLTASDDQLIFNSENNVFKIVSSNSFSVGGTSMSSGSTTTTTVPHGLGYIPVIHIYVNAEAVAALQGGGGLTGLPLTYVVVPNAPMFTIQYRIDEDNLYIDFINHLGGTVNITGYTWDFKYYLMQETAN